MTGYDPPPQLAEYHTGSTGTGYCRILSEIEALPLGYRQSLQMEGQTRDVKSYRQTRYHPIWRDKREMEMKIENHTERHDVIHDEGIATGI